MKTTILFRGDTAQVVLTPEDKLEEAALALIGGRPNRVEAFTGKFDFTNGRYLGAYESSYRDPASIIITLDRTADPPDKAR